MCKLFSGRDTITYPSQFHNFSHRFKDLEKLNDASYQKLKDRTISENEKDIMLANNLRGIGKFLIGDNFTEIINYLNDNGILFEIITGNEAATDLRRVVYPSDFNAFPLLKEINLPEINIAGIKFMNLKLFFLDNILGQIVLKYSEDSNNAELPNADFKNSADKLKHMLVEKYGNPSGIDEYLEIKEIFNSRNEYLTAWWRNSVNEVELEIVESYGPNGIHSNISFDFFYTFRLEVFCQSSERPSDYVVSISNRYKGEIDKRIIQNQKKLLDSL